MKKTQNNIAVATAVSGIIALGATLAATPALAGDKEKCYGVAKAGHNDCATKSSSCAGTSKDRQPRRCLPGRAEGSVRQAGRW